MYNILVIEKEESVRRKGAEEQPHEEADKELYSGTVLQTNNQQTNEPQIRHNFPETWIWQDTTCKYTFVIYVMKFLW